MVTIAIITALIKLLVPVFVNIHHRSEEKPTPTPQTSSSFSTTKHSPPLQLSALTADSGSASTPSSSPAANPSADKRYPNKLTWDQDTATKLQQFKLCPLFPKTQPTCWVSRSAEGRVLAQRVERSRSFSVTYPSAREKFPRDFLVAAKHKGKCRNKYISSHFSQQWRPRLSLVAGICWWSYVFFVSWKR